MGMCFLYYNVIAVCKYAGCTGRIGVSPKMELKPRGGSGVVILKLERKSFEVHLFVSLVVGKEIFSSCDKVRGKPHKLGVAHPESSHDSVILL
jgi:hypothetical protein